MSFKEKSTWIMAVVMVGAYLAYLNHIVRRADNAPIAEVPYASTLLWTVGAVIVASIVAHIAVATLLASAAKIVAYRRGFQQW